MVVKGLLRQAMHMAKDSWYVHCMEHHKLDKKCILLESKNGEEIGSNIFHLLLELSKDSYQSFKIYVAVNKEKLLEVKRFLAARGLHRVKVIERYGLGYFRLLACAGYLVTDTSFPRRFLKRDGQVYMNTWHGTSFKKLGRDIPSGIYAIGNVQRNLLMADYIVSPSTYALGKLKDAYCMGNLYQGTYVAAGYPRNQVFFREKEREELRTRLGLQKKKIFCYMPTWRGVVKENDAARGGMEQVEEIKSRLEEIDSRLREEEILYLRLHPFVGKRISCEKYRHIRPFPDSCDVYEFLSLADCLVTDYSSVFFDYANKKQGKIILFLYDREKFSEQRDCYFSPESLPFPVTETVEELIVELRSPKHYDDAGFCRKYCSFEGEGAAQALCTLLLTGKPSGEMLLEKAQGNHKKNLLFYVGGLKRNGITTSFLNLMEYIDREKYNIYASFQEDYLKEEPGRVGILPEFVDILPISPGWNLTFAEAAASYLFYKKNKDSFVIRKYLKRFYRREYSRNFGTSKFNWVIQFTGYERKAIGLFQAAPAKRAIFVHNDMVHEMETKGNQHLLTLKHAYQEYDLVLPVSKDIYENTLSISGKDGNIHVVNNCHAFRRVLERAEEQICFGESTKCTVGYEEFLNKLESPGKKFISIGRYSPEKGHGMLLEAFAGYHRENPQSILIVIGGGGELYGQTKEKAEELGLMDSTVLLMSLDNPMPILKRCDLFILSSLYEGQGLVLFEADTLGVPAISTDVTGPRGFMEKYGGYLVPPTVEGILEGMHAYDRGEIKTLHIDYEEYNKNAAGKFMKLIKEG